MFELVLGKESPILPGSAWTQYSVEVLPNKMVCVAKKGAAAKVEIYYSSFKSAEFGIGNGNLWLQCELEGGSLVFCAPRKAWKSAPGVALVEYISSACGIADMKAYKQYTGPFFFLAMFK